MHPQRGKQSATAACLPSLICWTEQCREPVHASIPDEGAASGAPSSGSLVRSMAPVGVLLVVLGDASGAGRGGGLRRTLLKEGVSALGGDRTRCGT